MPTHPLLCAHAGCGYIIGHVETARGLSKECPRCGRTTVFTLVLNRMVGQAYQNSDELSEFDRIERLMRHNRGIDPSKC